MTTDMDRAARRVGQCSRFVAVLRYCISCALLMSVLALLVLPPVRAFDFDRLKLVLLARFGPDRLPVFESWQSTLEVAKFLKDEEKLLRINDFINDNTQFLEDAVIWQQDDYWATPLELIGKGQGDCEDLAIAKYFSLKDVGVDIAKLRLVYVRAQINTAQGIVSQAHMVLAYYPTPLAEPLVLDNLVADIRPASQRSDLQPVFSFNHEFLWQGVAGNAPGSSGRQLTRWEDLQKRATEEGIQ